MKLYSSVKLKEKIGNHPAGSSGIIIEIFEKTICYVEILDEDGNSIDVLYDVPIDKLEEA